MYDTRHATLGDVLSSISYDVGPGGVVTDRTVYGPDGGFQTLDDNTAATAAAGNAEMAAYHQQAASNPFNYAGSGMSPPASSGFDLGSVLSKSLPSLFQAGGQVGSAVLSNQLQRRGFLPASAPRAASSGLGTGTLVGIGVAVLGGLYLLTRKR